MNYTWKIEVMLRNGEAIEGYYTGTETNSGDVAKTLLVSDSQSSQHFFGITDYDKVKNIFVCAEDISVISISVANEL